MQGGGTLGGIWNEWRGFDLEGRDTIHHSTLAIVITSPSVDRSPELLAFVSPSRHVSSRCYYFVGSRGGVMRVSRTGEVRSDTQCLVVTLLRHEVSQFPCCC